MSKSKTDLFRLNMNRFNTEEGRVLKRFLDWGQLKNRQKGKHLYVWPNNKHKKRVRVKQYITSIPSRSQGEVNNVDHLLTMHCSAKKPRDLAREWCLTEGTQDVPKQVGSTEAPPHGRSDLSLTCRGMDTGPPERVLWCLAPRRKYFDNCGLQGKASVDWTSPARLMNVTLDWDLGNLEARLMLWTLFHVPQFLWCVAGNRLKGITMK